MSSGDEDEEPEEDYRIAKLYAAADKSTPEQFAALVDEVGTKDAIVYGGICTDAPSARAHFVLMALLDAEDGSVVECVEARRALLKAVVAGGGDGAGRNLVAALEGWICSELEAEAREEAISSFNKALKVLWEYEVVEEEELRAWQADERAGRYLRVPTAEAQRLHDRGRVFLEWVDHGEGEV